MNGRTPDILRVAEAIYKMHTEVNFCDLSGHGEEEMRFTPWERLNAVRQSYYVCLAKAAINALNRP